MDDVESAILDGWAIVGPRLLADARELRRRLARRRGPTLAHPPRAACLVLRAADRRLPRPPSPLAPDPSPLTISLPDLQRLCLPVTLEYPNLTTHEVAERLGTTPSGLLRARVNKTFRHHYVQGLGGRRGKPTPLLTSDVPLDPAARGFAVPDPAWRSLTRSLVDRLPADFPPQTLYRVPRYRSRGPDYSVDLAALHPEHPLRDPGPSLPAKSRKSLKLPKPPGDPMAWYLWKGDEYIGYDWRNGRQALAHLNHEIAKSKSRLARSARRKAKGPGPALSRGSLAFAGHAWLCPRCGRPCRLLFLPLPVPPPSAEFEARLAFLKLPSMGAMMGEGGQPGAGSGQEDGVTGGASAANSARCLLPAARSSFACSPCLHLRRPTRGSKGAWNEIVAYLTGGLLFGREVKRPAWFTRERKTAYTPRPTRPPSARRVQIEAGLLAGQDMKQLAAALGLSKGTVIWYAQQIYRRHGVGSLKELLIKHGKPTRPGMRGKSLGKRGEGRVYRHKRPAGESAATHPGFHPLRAT